jgi:hypothetical protein
MSIDVINSGARVAVFEMQRGLIEINMPSTSKVDVCLKAAHRAGGRARGGGGTRQDALVWSLRCVWRAGDCFAQGRRPCLSASALPLGIQSFGPNAALRMRMHCAVVYCPGACERPHCLCWLAAHLTRSVLGSQRSIVDQRQLRVIFKRSTFTIKFVSARLRHIFCQVSFPCAGTPQHWRAMNEYLKGGLVSDFDPSHTHPTIPSHTASRPVFPSRALVGCLRNEPGAVCHRNLSSR